MSLFINSLNKFSFFLKRPKNPELPEPRTQANNHPKSEPQLHRHNQQPFHRHRTNHPSLRQLHPSSQTHRHSRFLKQHHTPPPNLQLQRINY